MRRYKHDYITLLDDITDVELIRRDTCIASLEGTVTAEMMPLNLSPSSPYSKEQENFPWDGDHPNWPVCPSQELRQQLPPSTPTRLSPCILQPLQPLSPEELTNVYAPAEPNE